MRKTSLCLIGNKGNLILESKLTGLPLKEGFIIRKSMEFFNDPEPCMIHRSAVMKRVYMEIYEHLIEVKEEGRDWIGWDETIPLIREGINIKGEPQRIQFNIKTK